MTTLQHADNHYAARRFSSAATAYRALLERGDVPAERRDEVDLRVCIALGRAQQWDDALEAALTFYQQHRGGLWEVRALEWIAEHFIEDAS